MNIFSGLVSLFSGGFVKDVGDAIDKNVTSDEERLKLHNELAEINERVQKNASELAISIEQNVTARHQADMQSDSAFAKNVRPAVLTLLTFFTLIYASIPLFKEMTQYTLDAYKAGLAAIISLDMVVYGFYFGSRGVEKVAAKIASALSVNRTS